MLVSTDWLAQHLNDPNVRIADVRWYLFDKDKTGQAEYARGHIPGAVFFELEADLSSPRDPGGARHPLPTSEQFAEVASRAGIAPQTHVIVYDDRGAASAARLWWLLTYFGHANVAVLDGGIAQWIAEGRALQTDVPQFARTSFIAQPHPAMVVDRATVNRWRTDPRALILDVRVGERYRGEVEPIDPRAGHVPGAKNAPLANSVRGGEDWRFCDVNELRAWYTSLGAREAERIIAYCGSGVNASQAVFTLNLAGFDQVQLYAGSWSDWCGDPGLPVATGEA